MAVLGASAVLLVCVVRPRLASPVAGSWPHLAGLSAHQLLAAAVDAAVDRPKVAAEDCLRLAQIARTKHQLVRAATSLLLAAMGCLAVAAAVAGIWAVTR